MRRLALILVLAALPVHAQYLTPQDAGAAIEAQLSPLWATGFRQCELDWYNDTGDQQTHPNHVVTARDPRFAQCVFRGDFASIAVISRDDVALPSELPLNLDMEPTDHPGMTCKAIFKPCIADIDSSGKGFSWRADVYEVAPNHPGYPGDFGGWGWDLILCFSWDEDKDDVGDQLWCKTQGEGNDPENNNTDWQEVVEGL